VASSFPAYVAQNYEAGTSVVEATPDSAGTGATGIRPGSLVFFDTATQLLKICGANPALIMGISEVECDSARVRYTAQSLTPNGMVPVRILSPSAIVAMCSPTTPAVTHLFNATGHPVVNTSGIWSVDPTSTSNPRVQVVEIDITNGIFYVRFLAANLQGDAIAS